MDIYLGSLYHASILAQGKARDPCLYSHDIDHERSWVMLGEKGGIQRLDDEQILLRTRSYVGLELSVPTALQTANPVFHVKCDSGFAFITTRRVSLHPPH
jgi:hypothetical protein